MSPKPVQLQAQHFHPTLMTGPHHLLGYSKKSRAEHSEPE